MLRVLTRRGTTVYVYGLQPAAVTLFMTGRMITKDSGLN